MSGGQYDYKQFEIEQLASDIEKDLKKILKATNYDQTLSLSENKRKEYYNAKLFLIKNEDEEDYDMEFIRNDLGKDPIKKEIVLNEIKSLIDNLRNAAIRVKSLDWYMSADDGIDTYIEKIKDNEKTNSSDEEPSLKSLNTKLNKLKEQINFIKEMGEHNKKFEANILIKRTNNGYILKLYEDSYVFEEEEFEDISSASLNVLNFLCYNYLEGVGNKHSKSRIFIEHRASDNIIYDKLLNLLKDEKTVHKILEIMESVD